MSDQTAHAREALSAELQRYRRALQAIVVERDRQETAAAAARLNSDAGAPGRVERHEFAASVLDGLMARIANEVQI